MLVAAAATLGWQQPPPPPPRGVEQALAVDLLESGTARRLSSAVSEFSKALVESVAKNNQVLVSFTNRVRLDFAVTWVGHVRALGMTNFLIGGTDDRAIEGLHAAGTPCFSMRTNLPQGEWPWGSPSFKALGPHKIELIYKAISWGFEIIVTDIDALVLRDPFPYMARWPDAAFLTTSDHLGNTTNDDGLETHNGIHSAFNIGYMFFRKAALPLVEEWRKVIREQPRARWDQGEFNRLARHKWNPRRSDGLSDKRLFWSYKNELIGGVLNLALFAGGHNHFVSQFARRQGWKPYSVHTTYQYAAAAGKRHRLREGGVWIDPPAYYDPPGGLATFELDVPHQHIYPAGGMDVHGHVRLINHQLHQIASALAIASALGRKLIMPRVTCGYDKAWYALSSGFKSNKFASKGVFSGAHAFILPIFNCPIDHFLEVGMMHPVETIREFSLLENPRTPAAVKASYAAVSVDASAAAGSETTRLRKKFADVKLLNLTNAHAIDAVGGSVLAPEELNAFRSKFGYVSGSWCCAPTSDAKKGQPNSARFQLVKRTSRSARRSGRFAAFG